MLVTETTGIKLLPKIIVLNPKDGVWMRPRRSASRRWNCLEASERHERKEGGDTGKKP